MENGAKTTCKRNTYCCCTTDCAYGSSRLNTPRTNIAAASAYPFLLCWLHSRCHTPPPPFQYILLRASLYLRLCLLSPGLLVLSRFLVLLSPRLFRLFVFLLSPPEIFFLSLLTPIIINSLLQPQRTKQTFTLRTSLQKQHHHHHHHNHSYHKTHTLCLPTSTAASAEA
ncbi:hypothetical protein BGZ63DRAFT_165817 [Mariannaea sp. PMI_226]|nr:hypothetical protein BGZ63DRAFT_165817 [Mariannaea sp. PMI_226]